MGDEGINPIDCLADEDSTRRASTELVKEAMRQPTKDGLIRLDAILKASVDARVGRLQQEIPGIACKKGCGYCCCVSVSAFPFEIFTIADHVRLNWSWFQRWKLNRKISAYVKRKKGIRKGEQHPWCPFLADNCCSIHQVRPTICRTHHSTNLQACIQNRVTRPPGAQPFYMAAFPIYDGVYDVLGGRAGEPGGLDMAIGVGIALKNPQAVAEFLEGGDPFLGARKGAFNG